MNFKITINPLFIIQGIMCYMFGFFDIWCFFMVCSFVSEMGQALITRDNTFMKLCVHFTPIGIKVEDILPTFHNKLYYHFVGSIIDGLIVVICFGFEYYNCLSYAFILAFFRLFPLLPFEGGKLILNMAGRWFGTLKIATIFTKIGLGFGYGVCIFGFVASYMFVEGLLFLTIGGYLIYSNKNILYPITKKLYTGLASITEKPIKEIEVNGTETPMELSFYLNPHEETLFFAKGKRGVSQQKVVVGILEKEDASWLWKSNII